MYKMHPWHNLVILGLILMVVSFACNLPFNETNPTPLVEGQATIGASSTVLIPQIETQAETEIAHGPEETSTPEPESDLVEPRYRGFFILQNQYFIAKDFEGSELGIQFPSGTSTWYGDNEISVLRNAIFYSAMDDAFHVFRVDENGTQALDFIQSSDPVSIAVSPDGQRIAWGTSSWIDNAPQTELYIANMDGSNLQKVDQILASDQNDAWFIFHPLHWTVDGKLVYATGMTGIGGYLIFGGYNGLRIYDPQNDSIDILISDDEMLGICLSSVSDDISQIAIVCDDASRTVRVRELSTGVETSYKVLPDQNTAGSAKFSPSGKWLAYVIQRLNPEDEFGQVVVTSVDGNAPPQIIANNEGGTFNIEGWIDDESFLVTRYDIEGNGTQWRMNRTGTDVSQISKGFFVGFLP
ncbi:MAG: hypothetical protein CVU46_07240 [Chloroflexi bacterium HGW-Chloroflexi-8]|nr:MAG: hypothetical protein CVU46_07240 [Chloroflexi bacterium HGW-Chloroflexi-8]